MELVDKRIKALEYAIQYVPGTDDNHSASVLLEELKKEPDGGNRTGSGN